MNNHPTNDKPFVVFVPGGVTPVELSYGPLLKLIAGQIQPVLKDLEVYVTDAPPADYSLEMEVEGIRRAADAAGAESFHLVGYSAGGAVSLAFTARYPERLKSLALTEPAWIGSVTQEDAADWAELVRLMGLPPDEQMRTFGIWQMLPGVKPIPLPKFSDSPPPWMAKRPAGLKALIRAFNTYQLDQSRFRQFNHPVYYALGGLSTRFYERAARILAGKFPDVQIEEYPGRSHFDPPQREEPERFARALRALWARSDATVIV
jgi:pimeloyl-ACP methyl ester carboxylesterase